MTEIEKVKSEIKVLQAKLELLEELCKTKTPCEEAFKDWMGVYPTNTYTWQNDVNRWDSFQAGYNAALRRLEQIGVEFQYPVMKEND